MKQRLRQLLFEIEQLKRNKVQDLLLGIGLTPGQGQARILMSLASSEHVSQRKLADECIERKTDPDCRRAYRISLTDAGRMKAEEVKEGFARLEEMLFDGFGQTEMRELSVKLEKIKDNLAEKTYGQQ